MEEGRERLQGYLRTKRLFKAFGLLSDASLRGRVILMMTTKLSLSFLAGSLVPAVSLYLTGGSNRFNFMFGLVLGMALVSLPILLWPRALSQAIWSVAVACEQFLVTLRATTIRDPKPTVHSTVLEDWIKEPAAEDLPVGIAGDCVSALHNLGLALGKSQRVVAALTAKKKYTEFEALFSDALAATGRTR
jgi:hypothetical protein